MKSTHTVRENEREREGGGKGEKAASDEAENLVTVFRSGPKALSGEVEASSGREG